MIRSRWLPAFCIFLSLLSPPAPAQQESEASSVRKEDHFSANTTTKAPIDGIRDNSFLIEEAYNQEAGVVQHIFTGMYSKFDRGAANDREWNFSFTQEWPVFSQTHQFSYTIPYSFLDPDHEEHDSGVGDVQVNYRYQLTNDAGSWPAISPRISLIFPSGDEDRGLGSRIHRLAWSPRFPVKHNTLEKSRGTTANMGAVLH